jgi:hypothetical protein
MPLEPAPPRLDLYRIPLGAGAQVVRISGEIYEGEGVPQHPDAASQLPAFLAALMESCWSPRPIGSAVKVNA